MCESLLYREKDVPPVTSKPDKADIEEAKKRHEDGGSLNLLLPPGKNNVPAFFGAARAVRALCTAQI